MHAPARARGSGPPRLPPLPGAGLFLSASCQRNPIPSETETLAELANTRTLLAVAAFQWRKLAEKSSRTAKAFLAIGAGSGTAKLARKPNLAKALKRTRNLILTQRDSVSGSPTPELPSA